MSPNIRNRDKILTILLVFLLAPLTAHAARPKQNPIPQALLQLEKSYVKASTVSAKFVQVNDIAATALKKTSDGYLTLQRPDRFRWETLKPDKNLLVSDGKTFWFYTPPFDETEKGQVVVRRKSQVNSKMASLLLSGNFSAAKKLRFITVSEKEFDLKPIGKSAEGIRIMHLTLADDGKTIQKVILEHQGGNKTEITLSEVVLGLKLDPGTFNFAPPPGTDVVKE